MIKKVNFGKSRKSKKINLISTIITKRNDVRPINNVYEPILHIDQNVDEFWDDEEEEYEFGEE